jgi:MacB-like periplasmic core domain/FtsX-like permease family
MSQVLRFVWYRFGRTLRGKRLSLLTIALVVGLVGGLGLGAAAGARRTQSAFADTLAATNTSDLQLQFYSLGSGTSTSQQSVAANLYSPALARQIANLPHVRAVAAQVAMFLAPLAPDGAPFLPKAFADNEVATVGNVGGESYRQDRLIADQGRLPDPSRSNEFAATEGAAALLHWHVGQRIAFDGFSFAQVGAAGSSAPTSPPPVRIDAMLVGIVSRPATVVHDEVDQYPVSLVFTPALTSKMIAAQGAGYTEFALRLDRGSADVAAVERELVRVIPPGSTYNFHVTSVVEGQVERAIKPESIALGAFGVIAVLAALFIGGQAIGRRVRLNAQELRALRAIGASPAMTIGDSLFGIAGAILVGAMLAVVVCVALSPLAPIGSVRQIEPNPGISADWAVIGAGFGILVVGLGSIAAMLALSAARRASRPRNLPAPRPVRLVEAATRLGLAAPAITGIRFAVEHERDPNAVPVRSALLGAAMAIALVVTTFAFGSGLNTLVSSPRLYGWNWSYAIEEEGGGNIPPLTGRLLDHDQDVASWSGFNFANATVGGMTVPILLASANAPVSPPILSGHAIEGSRQIVLGGTTLTALHKHVGDTIIVSYGTPADAPIYVPPTTMRIVGTATLPAIGNSGALHTSMGTGAIIPDAIEPPAMRRALTNPDPNLNGPNMVAIKLRSGISGPAAAMSLQRIVGATNKLIGNDSASGGGTFVLLNVQQPAEIVNYRTMGAIPAILAAALAAGATAALALTLVASVRQRRRDLALLRTLGFLQRQLASVVVWQASVAAAIGILFGVPIGIIVGRWLWILFARSIDAVPDPTIPVVEVTIVALVALVLANLVAAIPGRIAARTPAGLLLRAE